jgi:hypothetical protein
MAETLPTAQSGAAVPVTAAPVDELSALVTWGAALFYWAENGVNDGVKDYWDALHYIATSLSVGYANIFPVTPLGKTIGSVVQMIGPALSSRALDSTDAPSEQATSLGPKLDAILAELQKLNAR